MAAAEGSSMRVDAGLLQRFVSHALEDLGFVGADAAIAAEVLVACDLRGIKTHGTYHLGGLYLAQIRGGGINVRAKPHVVRETAGTAVIEGEGGLGQLAAVQATELAAHKARAVGCATVIVRNSNHTGALGHYVTMLAQRGMVGLAAQNTPPAVAPPGAAAAVIGNQPTAFGAPDPDGLGPIVLDIALSAAAASKIGQMRQRGEPIPEGWIVDAAGVATTDANSEFILAPMGAHKGYGLSVFVEVMTGVLGGGAVLSLMNMSDRSKPFGMSFWVSAFDVEAFMAVDEFKARMAEMRRQIHGAPTAPGAGPLILPGEPEATYEADARANGIPMDAVNWAPLMHLATELGRVRELEQTRRA